MNLDLRLTELEQEANIYAPNQAYSHDVLSRIAVLEAIAAAKEGNFGVGAVIANEQQIPLVQARNSVMRPYFRSDGHAEMNALSQFEQSYQNTSLANYMLLTSLEPCPMCFGRSISSRVGKVLYIAEDELGGAVQKMSSLPPIFVSLASSQKFSLAECSPTLKQLAKEAFRITANSLNAELYARLHPKAMPPRHYGK